jgi:hypothetical protein
MTRVIWLAVPVLGLVELGAHLHDATRIPEPDEWRALAEPVRQMRADDALVVVAPAWAEPMARRALGDELMPLAQVARPDAHRYARAIEISVTGASAQETEHWRAGEERQQGPFRLRVLENPQPPAIQFDFVERFGPEQLSVHLQGPAQGDSESEQPCRFTDSARVRNGGLGGHPTFPARRFACGGGDAQFVAVTVIDDVDYAPRRCIWAPPTPGGAVVLRYRDVPLGSEIHGHAGFPWVMVRDTDGPPVRLEIRVGGRPIGTHVARDPMGWAPFSFPVGATKGQRADVELAVRSDGGADRPFCFYADTR